MKRIATTVVLNRSSIQVDDAANARLEAYLADAARTLEGNPDREEILGDLEQAVADQCTRRLPPGESIVTLAVLEPGLAEIGPLQVPGATPDVPPATSPARTTGGRPLQQISEGAVIAGVCQGVARYMGLDVTLVRVLALILLFLTGGAAILVYAGLMLLLPYAPPEPGAPAIRKLPLKCRELVLFLRSKLTALTS